MSFINGASCENSGRSSCRADGSRATFRTCRYMLTGRWAYGTCSWMDIGVTLRILWMSTGAKHLHGDRPEHLSACKRLTLFSVRLH